MSTDINNVRLPRRRQYNWHLVFRHWRLARKVRLVVTAILIGVVMYAMNGWLNEMLRRMDAEAAHSSLKADVFKLANFGAPGWTPIWDTTDPQVRRPQ